MKNRMIFFISCLIIFIVLFGLIYQIISINKVQADNTSITKNQVSKNIAGEKEELESIIKSKNLSLYESKYYDKLQDNKVECLLCPKDCIIETGKQGDCKTRINLNGTLYSLVYGRPVTIALDPIEKKPFFHFLPKETTLSIATAGCNMHCINCQNWQISQLNPFDMDVVRVVSPKDVVDLAIKNNSRIISYTYNDPVVYYEYVLDTAKIARQKNIKNVLVTAAQINEEPLKELCKYIDAATVDIKAFNEKFYRSYTTGKLAPALNALKIMKKEGVWLEVSNLVIPGANDSDGEIRKLCQWIKDELGDETPFHFLRFYPQYKLKNLPPTPEETMMKAYNIAKETGLKYVYIGNLPSEKEQDTFCPNCKNKIIEREGYRIKLLKVKKGKCEFCGYNIRGVWN